jgi:hypothetical protein
VSPAQKESPAIEDVTPQIEPIRVELLSTELPIHQLAKRGQEEIRIVQRKVAGGQVSLYWKVEPNLTAGRPGQLAYHLDTWVINRRLDDIGRPVPRIFPIGDLRQIARELGLGGDTNAVRTAFEQNAAAFIRAKVAYRTKDGREETLEGYFNRYNVFYRGQKLPGGNAAETVYISLNDPYYSLINNSPRRPLDYRYLRGLGPSAQRFYELVSPKFFAAIKNGHPTAWVRYSDFCLYSVQKRQATRRRMQIQMAVVHRPHVKAGYIADLAYRPASAPDGAADWIISYIPGPRARAEFNTFNRSRVPSTRATVARPPIASLLPLHPADKTTERLRPVSPEPSPAVALAIRFSESRHGVRPHEITPTQLKKAEALLSVLGGDAELAAKAVDLAVSEARRDPGGYPSHLGGVLEAGYPERVRAMRDDDARRRQAEKNRADELTRRERHEAWCAQRANERVAQLSQNARERLIEDRLPEMIERYRYYLQQRSWTSDRVRDWAAPRILKRYGREGEPTYTEWCTQYDTPSSTGSSGPDEALQ